MRLSWQATDSTQRTWEATGTSYTYRVKKATLMLWRVEQLRQQGGLVIRSGFHNSLEVCFARAQAWENT